MANYTFESLNDKEFELLVRDLLQKELKITLESFKKGRDKGIDLRYSTAINNDIVIQCKDWLKSGFTKLKSHLKTKELKKVKKLNPNRYIIATSIPLSPNDKEDLIEIFAPYIKRTSDILGQDDLNNLLRKYSEVEESHYKLWLSSTNILKKITTEYIRERSRLYAEEIKEKVKLFVPTKSLFKAEKILLDNKILLVTGEPGIGKTMLANFLAFKYLKEDFELTFIQNDLKDAEKAFNKEKKQLFYFDDFLGRSYLEVLSGKKFDTEIGHLINAIRKHENHYLILTSRTTIYNTAKYKSEYFDDEKFNTSNIQLELTDYNYKDRGEILYNHLYFSTIEDKYKNEIREDRFYLEIVEHKNFNPRIIEFITDKDRIAISKPNDYTQFILDSLNNPIKIWEKAFQHQIGKLGKYFLQTLYTFNLPIEESKFRPAFKSRLDYEAQNYGFEIPTNYYNRSVKTLLNGFIKRYIKNGRHKTHKIDFINPSVADFLSNYLSNKKDECYRILNSVYYYEQIRYRFISSDAPLNDMFSYSDLEDHIIATISDIPNFQFSNYLNELHSKFGLNTVEPSFRKLLPHHLDRDIRPFYPSIKLLIKCYKHPGLKRVIDKRIEEYISFLIKSIGNLNHLSSFKSFLDLTEVDTRNFIKEHSEEILDELYDYFFEYFDDIDTYEIDMPSTSDGDEFEEELLWKVDDLLDEKEYDLRHELKSLGIDEDRVERIDFLSLKPHSHDIVDEIISDMADSARDIYNENQFNTDTNTSYEEYLDNLFS